MSNETAIEERFSRARSESMEASVISWEDPVIAEVTNEDSSTDEERTYTVVPDRLYCGCDDARYRDVVCKHLIFLAEQDTGLGQFTREALTDYALQLQSDVQDLRSQLDDLQNQSQQVNGVRNRLDVGDDTDDAEADEMEDESESGSRLDSLFNSLTR